MIGLDPGHFQRHLINLRIGFGLIHIVFGKNPLEIRPLNLAGVDMMVETYETLGFGQWFRYVTGVVEVGSALLLWLPGKKAWGAGLLVCTMIGALFANLFLLNSGALPAIILGGLSAVVLFAYREQLPKLG